MTILKYITKDFILERNRGGRWLTAKRSMTKGYEGGTAV